MIPAGIEWRDMDSVPRDGTIVAVKFHPWNVETNPSRIQLAQWLDPYGTGGAVCAPFDYDSRCYAVAWCHLSELKA